MRRSALVLGAAALLAGCGGSDDADAPDLSDPGAMMLRLEDLPPGYRRGDDAVCGQLSSTEGASPRLDSVIRELRPQSCRGEFVTAWRREPRLIQSILLVFRTVEDAQSGWALRDEFLRRYASMAISEESREEGLGDAAARFDSTGLNVPGAGVVWRDGRLLVAVYEEGLAGSRGRELAAELAQKQNERIRAPNPQPDRQDREVALDDPSIALPVFWLGQEFEAPGLPRLELYEGVHLASEDGPGNQVKIDYAGQGVALHLDLWKPATFEKFKTTRLGRMVWDSPCARRSELRLDQGRATIFGGYGTDGCPKTPPNHWLAHVYLDGVVLTVNMSYCYSCGGRPADDPYNSRRGLEAVVRGLRRR